MKLLTLNSALAVAAGLMSHAALADHSLKGAMDMSSELKTKVETAMTAKGVVCDLDHSLQILVSQAEEFGEGGTDVWRQVAFCHKTSERRAETLATLTSGNELGGIYGLPVDAILDVSYEWKYGRDDITIPRVVSLSLK